MGTRAFLLLCGVAITCNGALRAQRIAWAGVSTPEPFSNDLEAFSATDASGNTVIVGSFTGSFDMGGLTVDALSDEAVFAVKVSPDGGVIWTKRFVSDESLFPDAFAMDDAGNVIISFEVASIADEFYFQSQQYTIPNTGQRRPMVKLAPNGSLLALEFRSDYQAMTCSGADIYALGANSPLSVYRYDSDLALMSYHQIGNISLTWPKIATGPGGMMVVAGLEAYEDSMAANGITVPNDPVDMSEAVVLGMDTSGTVNWIRTVGQESHTEEPVYAVAVSDDSAVYVGLGGDSTFIFAGVNHPDLPDGAQEVGYLCAFHPDGTGNWSIPVYGNDARVMDVEIGPEGDIYAVADLFEGGSVFGQEIQWSTRGFCAFRVDPQGEPVWMKANSHLASFGVQLPWGIGVAPDGSCRVNGQGRDFMFDCFEFTDASSDCHFIVRIEDGAILEPEASFTWTNDVLSVQFADASLNADEWEWDLGDGTTSTEASPLHTYPANDVYTVTLEARRGDCESTVTQEVDLLAAAVTESKYRSALLVNVMDGGVMLTLPTPTAHLVSTYDACGRLVRSLRFNGSRHLPLGAGAYIFTVDDDHTQPVRAVVGQ
jgi:hypothetical protein